MRITSKKTILHYILPGTLLCLLMFLVFSTSAEAATNLPNPLGTTDIREVIAQVIQAVLGIIGAVALVMFIYGGFMWLTAGGKSDRIQKGKDILIWSVIGLVVIFGSYALVNFILRAISQ